MSSNPSPTYAIAWLYIDGNIIQNGVDGYSYDRQMSRLIKLDVTFNYKQLCDTIYTKLNIDANLYKLKIMGRCFNPVTKMFGVAPILDDDDVELMFELVLSLGVKNCVVELYLERVLVDGFVEKSVDVVVGLNSSSGGTGLVSRDFGKRREKLEIIPCLGKRKKNVKVNRDLRKRDGNAEVEVSQDVGKGGEIVEGSGDLGKGGEIVEVDDDDVESGGSSKKAFYMQRVDNQGKRVSGGGNKGGDSGIPLYRSFNGSFLVASLKEPLFTKSGDVFHVTDLQKGMVFSSREEMSDIVFQVHYRNQQEVKVIRADSARWTVDCKQKASGCKWNLTATKRKRHGFFEIMNIPALHTCVNPTIAQADANLICSNVEEVPNTQVVDPSD